MLLLFTPLIACSLDALTRPPIDRDFCKANINGHSYNMVSMAQARGYDTFQPNGSNYIYYIKLCQEIDPVLDNIPNFDKTLNTKDVFIARCDKETNKCEALITENEFDWKLYSPNGEDGVIYYAEGEPIQIEGSLYFTFDFELELTCNPLVNETTAEPVYEFEDGDDYKKLRMKLKNSLGCGQTVALPTPTPQPYEPDCHWMDRLNDTGLGIDLYLTELNKGSYGIRVPVTIGSKSDYVVFYQPCERMECPLGYNCASDNVNYSSSWLCRESTSQCVSYGVSQNEQFITPVSRFLDDGIYVDYKRLDLQRSTRVRFECRNVFPKGHISFERNAKIDDDVLYLTAKTEALCLDIIPEPEPNPPGRCTFKNTIGKASIDINIDNYSKKDTVGWKTEVQFNGRKATLMYEPCDNIYCPTGADCDGDEDATVFLCTENNAGKQECTAFGLIDNNIKIAFQDPKDITQGISVTYGGDLSKFAYVNWKCDDTLQKGKLTLPTTVERINSKTISFTVYSADACPSGEVNPVENWHPPRPKRPTSPTPTPQPSPNPTDLYVINETHYILSDLNNYYQPIYRGTANIKSGSSSGKVYIEYHPWDLVPCPEGYVCSNGVKDANIWVCWTEDDGTKYCHDSGDKRISNSIYVPHEKKVILQYGGVWDLSTDIHVTCDPTEANNSITFDDISVLRYSPSIDGAEFIFYTSSGATCPRPFLVPNVPSIPKPTPTANPEYHPIFNNRLDGKDNKYIDIDLKKLLDHKEPVVLGYGNGYERDTLVYYPYEEKTAPLNDAEYTLLDDPGTKANVWRLFKASNGNKYAHSLGSAKYGLNIGTINSDINNGFAVRYDGGYSGYKIQFLFQCNTSIPENQVNFDDAGTMTAQKMPIVFALTSMVCPKEGSGTPTPKPPQPTPGPEPTPIPEPTPEPEPLHGNNKASGGAVFLLILLLIMVFYLVTFTLIGLFKNGTVEIPHHSFWTEVGNCISTAVIFIFTCGKRRSNNVDYDYSINNPVNN